MLFVGLVFVVCTFERLCAGYNVEVSKVGVATGEADSQFGYTVAFVNDPDPGDFQDKMLLAGSPNLTVDGIRAHGDVFACTNTKGANSTCTQLHVKDTSGNCARLRGKPPTRSHCEEDSRMGATLAVNRKFDVILEPPYMVTACAPGWKSVYREDSEKFEKYMFGMCLQLNRELNTLGCHDRRTCWPFWGGNVEGEKTNDDQGRAVFAYAVGGFSATFTTDGKNQVIGAPGVNRNRGAIRDFAGNWLIKQDFNQKSTTYYGYALASGMFENGGNLAVGTPNFHTERQGHRGKVYVNRDSIGVMRIDFGSKSWTLCEFLGSSEETIQEDFKQYSRDVGSKFGAALAAIDITGDGYDELFIGAPLYSDKIVEEGRVFVFNMAGDSCLLGILSGAAKNPSLEDQTMFGRFGTSISTAGDLDADGYNEVAIGAPYENDGSGVVYIYTGIGKCNCHMPDKYSQRIVGKSLDPGIRSFGFSIFGGDDDVDNNGFPDLAVGAYASSKAFVLRSRPVASVTATLDMSPRTIPLVATDMDCSENNTFLCFEVKLEIRYEEGPGNDGRPINVHFVLDADTKYKKNENGNSRIVFRDNKFSVLNDTFEISKNGQNFTTYILDVLPGDKGKPEPRDPWTTVQISGRFELVPTAAADAFGTLDHVLDKSSSRNFFAEADFDKKCDNIVACTSDLELNVDLYLLGGGVEEKVNESTVIYVDDKTQIEMTMEVTNNLNTSYRTNVSADVLAVLRRDVSQNGAVQAECKYELYAMPTRMNCTAQEELDKNEDMRVTTNFDISRARLVPDPETLIKMQQFVNISVLASQGNTDNDPSNNRFFISIPVMIKSEIDITVDTQTSQQVRFNADPESTRSIDVRHIYYVTNNGPSFLPKTYVNISIPYKRDGETFARVESNSDICIERGKLVQPTTAAPPTEKTTFKDYGDIDEPEKQRKRREAPDAEKLTETTSETKEKTTTTRNITCEEYECIVFECKLVEMEKSDTKTIDLSIIVAEKEIAREKGVRQVRFVTKAVATPPSVWFSGKVVPWDGPEEEEKTTKFIVEPASVVTEVNIWIIIGSVLGAVALLIIIMAILWKTGFFRRKKQQQLRQMRQESLYKRRSQRATSTMSTSNKTNPPYNQIEAVDDKS